jgi:Zn-dependent protease
MPHELGHSIVARRYQIPVRRITLFIFGGVSQIEAEAATAGADFRIAVAGPLVSLALAALFTILQPAVAGVSPSWPSLGTWPISTWRSPSST